MSLIDKLIKNKQRKLLQKHFYNVPNTENKKWHSINYVNSVSNAICNRLSKSGINTISSNKNNLGRLLVNNKEKTDDIKKSGVYEIKCDDCDAVYIGQSGRSIDMRVKEHRKSILDNKKSTGFAEHCIDKNHFFNVNSVKLLHNVNKGKILDMLEILEIKKALNNHKYVTNTQIEFVNTPIIDTVIKLKLSSR